MRIQAVKKKTEAKRQAILQVAADAFQELGFEKTSMSEICSRVGGSKATIYNYFASKEELFFEVMSLSTENKFQAVHNAINQLTEDIRESLYQFGERLLTFLYSPDIRAQRHLGIAESGRTDLGRITYERGVLRSQNLMTDFLQNAMKQGKLKQADPVIATRHLYSLLESELLDRFLFQILEEVSDKEVKMITIRAIDVFMAAYGIEN